MSNQIEQKLNDARRELELHSDNILILQSDLQRINKEYQETVSEFQARINLLEAPVQKAKINFDKASREFARAQKAFEQDQTAFRNAQETFDSKKQNEIKQTDSAKFRMEELIKNKEQEIKSTHARMKNAERDVAEYVRQLEKEKRDNDGDGGISGRRTRFVA